MSPKELILALHAKMAELEALQAEDPSIAAGLHPKALELVKKMAAQTKPLLDKINQQKKETPAPEPNPNPEPQPAPAKTTLSKGVGYKQANLPDDVLLVRQLLNKHFGYGLPEVNAYDKTLENTIYRFQLEHCGMTKDDFMKEKGLWADATVTPNGLTWKVLASGKSRGKANVEKLQKRKDDRLEQEAEAKAKEETEKRAQEETNKPKRAPMVLKEKVVLGEVPARWDLYTNGNPSKAAASGNLDTSSVEAGFRITSEGTSLEGVTALNVCNANGEVLFHRNFECVGGDELDFYFNVNKELEAKMREERTTRTWGDNVFAKGVGDWVLNKNPMGQMAQSILFEDDLITGERRTGWQRVGIFFKGATKLVEMGTGGVLDKADFVLEFAESASGDETMKEVLAASRGLVGMAKTAKEATEGFNKFMDEYAEKGASKIVAKKLKEYGTKKLKEATFEELLSLATDDPELVKQIKEVKKEVDAFNKAFKDFQKEAASH